MVASGTPEATASSNRIQSLRIDRERKPVRAVQYTEHGGPEVLNVIQIPELERGPVDVADSCMNSIDESALWVQAQRDGKAIVQRSGLSDKLEVPTW